MDCLVLPLQDKLEDWKKAVFNLDKEHAKGRILFYQKLFIYLFLTYKICLILIY